MTHIHFSGATVPNSSCEENDTYEILEGYEKIGRNVSSNLDLSDIGFQGKNLKTVEKLLE